MQAMETQRSGAFLTAQLCESGGRANNEDFCSYLELDGAACWVVADGLGGHRGGELASKTAAEVVLQSFRGNREISSAALESHIGDAQTAILELQRKDPSVSDMRTTVVALISDSRQVLWAHVGDSRLYRFQGGDLVFQTEDHSVPQSLVRAGEIVSDQIRGHCDRNRLLRSLGEPGPPRPTLLPCAAPLSRGDAFLLCTDGFWEYVWETEMLADLAASDTPEHWLERSTRRLRQRARAEHDNYSALAIFCLSGEGVPGSPLRVTDDENAPQGTSRESRRRTPGGWFRSPRRESQSGRREPVPAGTEAL